MECHAGRVGAMRLEIERLPSGNLDEFIQRFYEAEQPVILTGLESQGTKSMQSRIWALAHGEGGEAHNGYYSSPIGLGAGSVPVPEIVERVFSRDDIAHKPEPLRLWMQPRNNCTGLHYDGNSLCGLNWHVIGRKHWLLIAPNRLLPMMPLTYLTMTPDDFEPGPDKYDVMEFVVEEGEMLFIPRYWAHRVTTLSEVNANLNWVWTRRVPNRTTPVGRRESATLKVRSRIGRLNRYITPRASLADYGDGGPEMFDSYTRDVTKRELVRFVMGELVNCVMYPFRSAAVHNRQSRMHTNNFHDSLNPFEAS